MPRPINHRELVRATIIASLENACDDMGDDGIKDAWIAKIGQNLPMLADLIELRHSLTCDRGDELPGCASCGDDLDEMHMICCELPENDEKCRELIDSLVYGDFIRPRWESDPNIANDEMRIHLAQN